MTMTWETDERGRAVACKWASGDGVARLRHEAEVLEAARHPGVVELLDVRFDGPSASLRLAAAPGPSLDRRPTLTADEAAGVVAAVAATVADLHAAGIVHRAIEAAHVVLDGEGRPLLCGFADAVVVGAAAGAVAGGEADEVGDADAAVDVAALGALLAELAGGAPPVAGRPDPRTEVLAAIASWASSPDAAARPSAGDLAAAIATRVPSARLPRPADLAARGQGDGGDAALGRLLEGDSGSGERRRAHGGRRRLVPVAGVVAAAVVALAGFASGMSDGAPSAGPRTPRVTASDAPRSTTSTTAMTSTTTDRARATRVWPGSPSSTVTTASGSVPCPPVDEELRADVDGDGCVEALAYAAGVVSAGSRRWAVGGEGDRVATGDWWCRGEGRATLAVLRSADRSVWVFEEWPAEVGARVAARPWGTVARATGLRAVHGPTGCAVLTVERAGQPPVTLAPPRADR